MATRRRIEEHLQLGCHGTSQNPNHMSIYNVLCVCAFVCMFVCLCVFVPVLCHSIYQATLESLRDHDPDMAPREDGGTWWRQMSKLLGSEWLGMEWHRTGKSGRRSADSAVPMTSTRYRPLCSQQFQHECRRILSMLMWVLLPMPRRPHTTQTNL